MTMSISIQKSSKRTNIKHNNRNMSEKEKEKNPHIDFSKSDKNKYLIQKDLKELYEKEFGPALEKYNAKQKRNDRKIDNYYEHIKASKKTALQQEMIVQVGDKDDFMIDPIYKVYANDILKEWVQGFEERNPQLKIYNAVIHNDEASPHLHINFVPVAEGYKRGLEKQVSFDRAIIQQDSTLDKTRLFDEWREKEVSILEKSLNELGFERKIVGKNEYKDVNEYKEKKDLQREIKKLDKELVHKKNELLALNEKVSDDVQIKAKKQMKTVEVPTGEKSIFGKEKMKLEKKPTGNVILNETDFKELVEAVRDNQRLKNSIKTYLQVDSVKENQKINEEITMLRKENTSLKKDVELLEKEKDALEYMNSSLRGQISSLKAEINILYQNTKGFLKERTNDFKGVLRAFVDKVNGERKDSLFGRLYKEDESEKQKENSFSIAAVKEIDRGIKNQKSDKKKGRSKDMEL